MKITAALFSLSSLILSTGCAGPIGPPLGLGPGWDELAAVAIFGLIAALAYRSIRKLLRTHHERGFAVGHRKRTLRPRRNQSG